MATEGLFWTRAGGTAPCYSQDKVQTPSITSEPLCSWLCLPLQYYLYPPANASIYLQSLERDSCFLSSRPVNILIPSGRKALHLYLCIGGLVLPRSSLPQSGCSAFADQGSWPP